MLRTLKTITFVYAPQEDRIAAAINAMLADREALSRMHRNALKAAQELCWENESQQLIRLYQEILAR